VRLNGIKRTFYVFSSISLKELSKKDCWPIQCMFWQQPDTQKHKKVLLILFPGHETLMACQMVCIQFKHSQIRKYCDKLWV